VPDPPACVVCRSALSPEEAERGDGWCDRCWNAGVEPPDPKAASCPVAAYPRDKDTPSIGFDLSTATRHHLYRRNVMRVVYSFRHPKWTDQEFFISSILRTPDVRYFAEGMAAPSRQDWHSRVRAMMSEGRPHTYVQLDAAEAQGFLVDAGFDLPEAAPDGEREGRPAIPPTELPDLVTLDQAAAAVHKSKRTLELHKTKGKLPEPSVEGGGGRADLWDWKTLRPWLEAKFGIKLPTKYPANRRG
jgi:hypothetical protein